MKDRENFGAIIVTYVFVILITIGGILPITTYGQVLDSPKPLLTPPVNQGSSLNQDNNNTRCKCVVFRMDDIQDYWIENGQLTPMNLFISKNQSLSLGLIMNYLGNDSKIIDKVREGNQKGLFELALHGWNHVNYTKLSEQEQKDTLLKANAKMQKLFGYKSDIFITPLDTFNNNTLKAMGQLGLRIISAGPHVENVLNQNKSVFNANGQINNNETNQVVYHLPSTITFKDFQKNGTWIKIPLEQILSTVDNNIAKYGYAVIVIHPQDFVKVSNNGKFVNLVDINELKELSQLIDSILSKNIHITSFSKIVGIRPYYLSASIS